MKRCVLFVALMLSTALVQAASFRYQGNLQDGGKPAEGKYDLELTLYSAAQGGSIMAGPLMLNGVPVHNGSFSTEADFGPLNKVSDSTWLGVRVRTAGSNEEYVSLDARAPLSTAVTTSTTSVCPGAWTLNGNAGNVAGMYLGTADTQPLTMEVNALQAGQISVSGNSSYPQAANVVFGYSQTIPSTEPFGNTISGGQQNSAGNYSSLIGPQGFATVAGGLGNSAEGNLSTVGGGNNNQALANFSVVSGGFNNSASGPASAIGGGSNHNASGSSAVIAGGATNTASGGYAAVGGGYANSALATYATVPGGYFNFAGGTSSFAAGTHSIVRSDASCTVEPCGDYGTFAWADHDPSNLAFTSSGPNQFLVRSGGGVGINGTPFFSNVELTIRGSATAGSGDTTADLTMIPRGATSGYDLAAPGDGSFDIFHISGSGVTGGLNLSSSSDLTIYGAHAYKNGTLAWEAISDRRVKQDIQTLAGAVDTLLKLHPVSFRYTPEYRTSQNDLPDKPYLGFIAQEFREVFPDAVSSTGGRVPGAALDAEPILALDSSPALITAVAAAQELAVQVRSQHDEISRLSAENEDLRATLKELAERMSRLEQQEK